MTKKNGEKEEKEIANWKLYCLMLLSVSLETCSMIGFKSQDHIKW
jgi:hypothetical protein